MKLWLIQILHKFINMTLNAWKRAVKRESKNEKAEKRAHLKGTPGSRYIAHPAGKTARPRRGKARKRL